MRDRRFLRPRPAAGVFTSLLVTCGDTRRLSGHVARLEASARQLFGKGLPPALHASLAEIEDACRLANIHEFIASLPEGYETVVGERGVKMSGGEKQRVAIGRALVKDPTFVFADEPTSALDWENGQQVIELMGDAARSRGAMVLVVTHDPRLTPFADRVFELADGQLQTEPAHAASGLPRSYAHAAIPHAPRLRLFDPVLQ